MKQTSEIILQMYNAGKLTIEQVMIASKGKLLEVEDAQEILGPDYVEEEEPTNPPLITDAIEERFKLMEASIYSEMSKKFENIGEISFPDVVKGGNF